jgi:hypothetical protein
VKGVIDFRFAIPFWIADFEEANSQGTQIGILMINDQYLS